MNKDLPEFSGILLVNQSRNKIRKFRAFIASKLLSCCLCWPWFSSFNTRKGWRERFVLIENRKSLRSSFESCLKIYSNEDEKNNPGRLLSVINLTETLVDVYVDRSNNALFTCVIVFSNLHTSVSDQSGKSNGSENRGVNQGSNAILAEDLKCVNDNLQVLKFVAAENSTILKLCDELMKIKRCHQRKFSRGWKFNSRVIVDDTYLDQVCPPKDNTDEVSKSPEVRLETADLTKVQIREAFEKIKMYSQQKKGKGFYSVKDIMRLWLVKSTYVS